MRFGTVTHTTLSTGPVLPSGMTGQVTALPQPTDNPVMSVFGMLVAVPIVILLLPLLPFVVLLWAYDKLTEEQQPA